MALTRCRIYTNVGGAGNGRQLIIGNGYSKTALCRIARAIGNPESIGSCAHRKTAAACQTCYLCGNRTRAVIGAHRCCVGYGCGTSIGGIVYIDIGGTSN